MKFYNILISLVLILFSSELYSSSNDNQAPIVVFNAILKSVVSPLIVDLDASASNDPDGNIVIYSWLSSDGQTASGKTAAFSFSQVGAYDITLTLTDNQGLTASQSKRVTVAPTPKLASASFVATNNTPAEALPILVNDIPVQQVFFQPDDVDWYEFYAKASQKYTIEIPGNSIGAAINPSLQLYNANDDALTSEIQQTAQAKGVKVTLNAPYTGLFRLRVTNHPPFPRSSDASDYSYQLRVYLTDAPQQGLVKGYALNSCNSSGIGKAEVSAWLGNSLSDSTLTHKTGEYGLLLNPDNYQVRSSVANFLSVERPVTVNQIVESEVSFNQEPEVGCKKYTLPALDPTLQKQQAVAVYDESLGLLIVRDIWAGEYVYYAELQNVGSYNFQLIRAIRIPGTIHVLPGDYGYTPFIANLPTVFALGKTWKLQLKNQGDWLFTVEKAE